MLPKGFFCNVLIRIVELREKKGKKKTIGMFPVVNSFLLVDNGGE